MSLTLCRNQEIQQAHVLAKPDAAFCAAGRECPLPWEGVSQRYGKNVRCGYHRVPHSTSVLQQGGEDNLTLNLRLQRLRKRACRPNAALSAAALPNTISTAVTTGFRCRAATCSALPGRAPVRHSGSADAGAGADSASAAAIAPSSLRRQHTFVAGSLTLLALWMAGKSACVPNLYKWHVYMRSPQSYAEQGP